MICTVQYNQLKSEIRRRTTTGKDKIERQEMAETVGWWQWLWWQKIVAVDNNCGGHQQQRRMTTAVDNDGMWDWAADYDGKGWEHAANNHGIRHKAMPAGQQSCEKIKQSLHVDWRNRESICNLGRIHTWLTYKLKILLHIVYIPGLSSMLNLILRVKYFLYKYYYVW